MDPAVSEYLTVDDEDLNRRWGELTNRLTGRFGRHMTIEAILFLIGVQSQGIGYQPDIGRERKKELIMEGTYRVFERLGFYERAGLDERGFHAWERCVPVPALPVEEQEKLLRVAIIEYFEYRSENDD